MTRAGRLKVAYEAAIYIARKRGMRAIDVEESSLLAVADQAVAEHSEHIWVALGGVGHCPSPAALFALLSATRESADKYRDSLRLSLL